MYAYALVRSAINPQVKVVVQDPRFSSVATVAGSGMEAIGIAALDDGQGAGTFRLARYFHDIREIATDRPLFHLSSMGSG